MPRGPTKGEKRPVDVIGNAVRVTKASCDFTITFEHKWKLNDVANTNL
jgi:hypothetical protein